MVGNASAYSCQLHAALHLITGSRTYASCWLPPPPHPTRIEHALSLRLPIFPALEPTSHPRLHAFYPQSLPPGSLTYNDTALQSHPPPVQPPHEAQLAIDQVGV